MRIAVLVLALIGAVLSGLLGAKWLSDANTPEFKLARELVTALGANDPVAQAKLAELDQVIRGAYALIGSAVLGIIGGILAYTGRGPLAAALLLIAGIVPLIFTVKALLATALLIVAGALAFLIRPRAVSPQRPADLGDGT